MQLLAVQPAAELEEHVCVNHCHLFPKLSQHDWKFHLNDACPHCHELRFRLVSCGVGRKPRALPRRRFWHLGLERVIQGQCFANERWNALRKQSSSIDKLGFRTSKAAQDLSARLIDIYQSDTLKDDRCGLWTLGFDFFQPFAFRNHSTGAVGIRCVCWVTVLDMFSAHIQHALRWFTPGGVL